MTVVTGAQFSGRSGGRGAAWRPGARPRRPDAVGLRVDDAPVALVRIDAGGAITHGNAASHTVFEVRAPLLAGKPLFAYVSVDDHIALRLAMKRWMVGDAAPLVVRVCGRGRSPVAAQFMAHAPGDGSMVLAIAPLAAGLGHLDARTGGGRRASTSGPRSRPRATAWCWSRSGAGRSAR